MGGSVGHAVGAGVRGLKDAWCTRRPTAGRHFFGASVVL
jgi:hypothetical protein